MQLTATLKHVVARTRRLVAEDGQDLLEYALLVALIVLVAIGAVATVGNTIYSVFWKSIEVAF
jgi:Flp pilus assembly pilin Flp